MSSSFDKLPDRAGESGKAISNPAQGTNIYLAEMIRLYGGLVRHICRNALGDRHEDVDECISDVFVALWQKVEGNCFDMNADEIKPYICGITRNKAIDRYRKLAAQPFTIPLDSTDTDSVSLNSALSEPDIAELLAKSDDESLIAEVVSGLPSPDREVFILRYYYLERVKAIAEKLGMTEKAVENKLYRGKLSLRQKLNGRELSEERL